MNLRGVLIDGWYIFPEVFLWVKRADGTDVFVKDVYKPQILIEIKNQKGQYLYQDLIQKEIFTELSEVEKIDVWQNQSKLYKQVQVEKYARYKRIIKQADFQSRHIEYYNTDLTEIQSYYCHHNLYPLKGVEITYDDHQYIDNIISYQVRKLPTFRSLLLYAHKGIYKPLGKENPLIIATDRKKSYSISATGKEFLSSFNLILKKFNPDIIFTVKGDEFILPTIFRWSNEFKYPTLLDRENVYRRSPSVRKRSFIVYGRHVAKVTPFPLFGRLHIDKGISFFQQESKLEGIFEICRHSRLSIQKLARSSPGNAMSALEDEKALQKGYAIPRIKGKPPDFRKVNVLLKTDQGGISFRPPVPGVYENVLELDFRSLYPNIMRIHNVSGETVNCQCCQPGNRVPLTPYHTCQKRSGIVGAAISILLERRDEIIESLKTCRDSQRYGLNNRSDAIKWCLVTAFGYTGYKNAKYGRREAHESITAWGRECILTAKEIAEEQGYVFLHGLTDSVWLWKGGREFNEKEIKKLCRKVYKRVRIPLVHEATYSFLVFPESRQKPGATVATRYYARSQNGKIKIRGYRMRKSDCPQIIYRFQEELFEQISNCQTLAELQQSYPEFHKHYLTYQSLIASGKIDIRDLVIRKHISGSSQEYKVNNSSKIILEKLENGNIELVGGETIEYIVFDARSKNPHRRYLTLPEYDAKKGYDVWWYCRELKRAFIEIIREFSEMDYDLFGSVSR